MDKISSMLAELKKLLDSNKLNQCCKETLDLLYIKFQDIVNPENILHFDVYVDGSSIPNPGKMGVGLYYVGSVMYKKLALAVGQGTNNQAELHAILAALKNTGYHPDTFKGIELRIIIDSEYAAGVCLGNRAPSKNLDIISAIREEAKKFKKVEIVPISVGDVQGHKVAHTLAIQAARGAELQNHGFVNEK